MPALDGVRAVAVALVMAYHGGIPGFRVAGFYGVDIFFVLSGFLITRLLLDEEARQGGIRFVAFWGRRARRLLPGLLVMLLVVALYVAYVAQSGRYPGFRGDALSVLGYVSNWHFIAGSSDYFNSTAAPSLLTHTWSLAIEEQFYVVWPLLIWGAVRLARRRRSNPASVVLGLSAGGAVLSAAWMAVLYRSGADPSRLYYGTDTHAQCILVGCALAALTVVVTVRPRPRLATPSVLLAAGGLGWAACSVGSSNPLAYQGGFLVVAVLAALLVGTVVSVPSSAAARTLSAAPLAYVGRISYGMYLWYFPLFEVIDRARTGLTGVGLFSVRCAADVLVAAVSFHLIEQPLRAWRPGVRRLGEVGGRRAGLRLRLAAFGALSAGGLAVVSVGALVVADTPSVGSVSPGASSVASAAQVPTGGGQRGLRLLIFGDSTGATLGDDIALSPAAEQNRIVVGDAAMFGCGLVTGAVLIPHGQPTTPPPACRTGSPPQTRWPALLRAAIRSFHPDVVLIAAGRWEVVAREAAPGGPRVNITQPADAAYVKSQLQVAASIVASSGVRLAIATSPCFASGEQASGAAWPEDSPARVEAYNSAVRQVAASQPAGRAGETSVVDLDSMVCPGGKFHTVIDGVTVRAPDGIHYPYFDFKNPTDSAPDTLSQTAAFGAWIEPRILGALGLAS